MVNGIHRFQLCLLWSVIQVIPPWQKQHFSETSSPFYNNKACIVVSCFMWGKDTITNQQEKKESKKNITPWNVSHLMSLNGIYIPIQIYFNSIQSHSLTLWLFSFSQSIFTNNFINKYKQINKINVLIIILTDKMGNQVFCLFSLRTSQSFEVWV